MYEFPPPPAGLATQGALLYSGLQEIGVECAPVHLSGNLEKEWLYRCFRPDVAIGVGYWGQIPELVTHPRGFGVEPIPWLVADGWVANYQHELNSLELILATSNWVKEAYTRDGVDGHRMVVLPVGCDIDSFRPIPRDHPKVRAVRDSLGVTDDQKLILTIGGDGASKGSREMMMALARINKTIPDWRYVCKVWRQHRTAAAERAWTWPLRTNSAFGTRSSMWTGCSRASICLTSTTHATSTRGRAGRRVSACRTSRPRPAESPC